MAARIEALTKFYGAKLLMSGEALAGLSRQMTRRLVDRVIVKGKSAPVELFESENPCVSPDYSGICQHYAAAYEDYSAGRFAAAGLLFEKLDGRAMGAVRSIGLRLRCSPVAEKLVAEEVFEISFLAHDSARLNFKNPVQQLEHAFRPQRLRQRRGIPEIRQQHRDVRAARGHGPGICQHRLEHTRREVEPHRVAQQIGRAHV